PGALLGSFGDIAATSETTSLSFSPPLARGPGVLQVVLTSNRPTRPPCSKSKGEGLKSGSRWCSTAAPVGWARPTIPISWIPNDLGMGGRAHPTRIGPEDRHQADLSRAKKRPLPQSLPALAPGSRLSTHPVLRRQYQVRSGRSPLSPRRHRPRPAPP